MKNDYKNDYIVMIVANMLLLAGMLIVGFVGIAEKDDLKKQIKEKEETLVEQQRIIESQKCPAWLENYYYDHVCEEGCDVAE